jgi:hypothetical protein
MNYTYLAAPEAHLGVGNYLDVSTHRYNFLMLPVLCAMFAAHPNKITAPSYGIHGKPVNVVRRPMKENLEAGENYVVVKWMPHGYVDAQEGMIEQYVEEMMQLECKYTAICDYERMMLFEFNSGLVPMKVKVVVVPRDAIRKGLLGYVIEAVEQGMVDDVENRVVARAASGTVVVMADASMTG